MQIPVIRGIIDRRILANFRVDPAVLSRVLPSPFRPQLVQGHGIAGICLIRLKQLRPRRLPAMVGVSSENAAHRIAVEWDTDDGPHTGVYIPRRDTSSRFNVIAGGHLFPGVHHWARFEVREDAERYRVDMQSLDGSAHVMVDGQVATSLPADSVFSSVADVSQFFESGSLGYSPAVTSGKYDGLELESFNWSVEPLAIRQIKSSYFEDQGVFPTGSVTFDNALLMRGIDHQWHSRKALGCVSPTA